MSFATPAYASLALAVIPDPDFADMSISVLPAHATADPAAWARSLFPRRSAVREERGDEALLAFESRHLDIAVAVGVSELTNTVRVTTAVRIKRSLGRLTLWRVRILHPLLVQARLTRSRRRLSGVTTAKNA